jgi:predicted phosphoadenosine phosphosulfate sulfurtransferase
MLQMNLITQEELYRELDGELWRELYGELNGELRCGLNGELNMEVYRPLGFPIHTDFREYNTVC